MKKIIAYALVSCLFLSGASEICAAEPATNAIMLQIGDIAPETGSVREYAFTIDVPGAYSLRIDYETIPSKNITPQARVALDGADAAVFDLPRIWTMAADVLGKDGRFVRDKQGNEITPTYEEVTEPQTLTPLEYELKAGLHTLSLTMARETVILHSVSLEPVKAVKSYEEYIRQYENVPDAAKTQTLEAELISRKSHLEITLTYDRTAPAVSPNHPVEIRYNLLGGTRFDTQGQWVEWIVDVPETGLYELDFIYRQNINNGLGSQRKITIDGEQPFTECGAVEFPYSGGFTAYTVGGGEPNRFYFGAGQHTLRMEVVLTGLKETITELTDVIRELNLLYSRIMVIVGETPDIYRDYDLDKHIDGLADTLIKNEKRLTALADVLDKGHGGSQTARVREAGRMLLTMAETPMKIPGRMDNFRSQINTLADLLGAVRSQPLELDTLTLRAPATAITQPKSGFWNTLIYRAQAFIGSFLRDYNIVAGENAGSPLSVWVSANDLAAAGFATGRDQAQIVDRLASWDFTKKNGIPVRISLINTQDTLLPALVSGKGPDVAIFVPKVVLANLYYRNALTDLRANMPGYEGIEKRFYPSALVSLKVGNKTYALPDIQSYNMLFVRTDIFKQHDLAPPGTWTEFYSVLGRLQKLGMQAGIAESQQIYEMFLLQNGGALYDAGMTQTRMTDTQSVRAFTSWTELYVKYSLPKWFEPLNRFRTGQTPMVLTSSYFFGQLTMGAPEIAGQWAMLPIPGMESDDAVNRSETCNISGTMVLAKSKRQADAMRFLDWWTSNETQTAFAFESETRMGASGRCFPANRAVLETLAWTAAEQTALKTQWESVDDMPYSPAAYYVQRNLTNAFRRVTYNFENPRDVIYRYGKMMNDELKRKNDELGLS